MLAVSNEQKPAFWGTLVGKAGCEYLGRLFCRYACEKIRKAGHESRYEFKDSEGVSSLIFEQTRKGSRHPSDWHVYLKKVLHEAEMDDVNEHFKNKGIHAAFPEKRHKRLDIDQPVELGLPFLGDAEGTGRYLTEWQAYFDTNFMKEPKRVRNRKLF